MSTYIGEIAKQVDYRFDFSQRDIDLLISILFDLTKSHASIKFNGGNEFKPNDKTMEDLNNILNSLSEVGMSMQNDYLSNFYEV